MKSIPEQIKVFYDQLEKITVFDRWELMRQISPLTKMFNYKWNKLLCAEHICLRFDLIDGMLKADFHSVENTGKESEFPTIELFSKEQIIYLSERLHQTNNPLLQSRYNHILFYVYKNRTYALKAIKAYKEVISRITNDDLETLIPSVGAIAVLTKQVKFEMPETKSEMKSLLINNEVEIYHRVRIALLLYNSSLFKSRDLSFFPEIVLSSLYSPDINNYQINKEILLNTIKICHNLGSITSSFYEKLAENEYLLLNEHSDENDFVRVRILGDIVDYYKKAKNKVKYYEHLKVYTEIKSNVTLKALDISPNKESQREISKEINNNIKIFLKWDNESILYYFSNHSNLFPAIDEVNENVNEYYNKSFLKHCTNIIFDINNNVRTLTDIENLENKIYNSYMYIFNISVLSELIRLLQVGTYNRKITYNHVYEYLDKHTWYGQIIKYSKMHNAAENNGYKWINLMAPALHSFLLQIESSFLIGERLSYTSWILPIDSLTLKFEGALRDFIKLLCGNSSMIKRNEIQEMLLDDLLNCDTALNVFTKDDLTLFKLVFTNKGDNIRHSVAHGFYRPTDYTMEKCCKIFLCILRLGKYKLSPKINTNNN